MSACDACLRRTELIAAVAPRLDIEWRRRSAPAGVLALPDEDLLALDPTGCAERGYAAFSAAGARDRAERAGLGADLPLRRRLPGGPARARGRPGRAARGRPARGARGRGRRGDRRCAPRHPVRDRDRPRAGAEPRRRGRPGRLRHGARHRLGRARRRARRRRTRRRRSPSSPAGRTSRTPRRGVACTRGSSSAGASSPSCRPGSPPSAGASSPATGSSRRSRR